MGKRNSPISIREIKTVIVKLHNEGLSGNNFEATLSQYILEICGIDYSCPTTVYSPVPGVIKHRINQVSEEKRTENLNYWENRLFSDQ